MFKNVRKEWKMEINMTRLINATDWKTDMGLSKNLDWLTAKEAAVYLRKTANALRIMTYRGYVRPRKLRNRLYFRKIELDRLLETSAF